VVLSGDFFKFRELGQFILHDFARGTNTFPALRPDRDKLSELLKRLRTELTHSLADLLITNTITQTNVHIDSRTISDQSVNENGYDFNSVAYRREKIMLHKKSAPACAQVRFK